MTTLDAQRAAGMDDARKGRRFGFSCRSLYAIDTTHRATLRAAYRSGWAIGKGTKR